MYILTNTKTGEVEPVGSITSISKLTGIAQSSIYHQFSRNKKKVWTLGVWKIEKKNLIIGKR